MPRSYGFREEPYSAEALRFRSTAVGCAVLLLWALGRLLVFLEKALLPQMSHTAGALFSLIGYCLMLGLPILLLRGILPLPGRILFPLGKPIRASFWFLPMVLGTLTLLNILGWGLAALLRRTVTVPPYAPAFGSTPAEITINLLASTLFPAVLEELFFRGAVLQGLRGFGERRALAVGALLFMVCHPSVLQWVPALGAGFLFGWLALRTGSLRWGILLHLCYNLYAALSALFPGAWSQVLLPGLFILVGSIAFFVLLLRGGFRRAAFSPPARCCVSLWTIPLVFAVLLMGWSALSSLTLVA